jgi:hypothetical protein
MREVERKKVGRRFVIAISVETDTFEARESMKEGDEGGRGQ